MIDLPAGDFVIADLEYTSWEGALERGWDRPGEFREIVQIGAVKVQRSDSLRESDSFMVLVAPTLNPVLSDYFTDLTGITNPDIARAGVPVAEALERFVVFVAGLPILTHGPHNLVITEECEKNFLTNPLADHDWRDINPMIHAVTGQRLTSSELPEHFGLPQNGQTHDALADARALLQVLAHLQVHAS
jgi:inhibitor of KinA sporulation pathway (predicted exonuclease)